MLDSFTGKPGKGELPMVVLAQAATAKPENLTPAHALDK